MILSTANHPEEEGVDDLQALLCQRTFSTNTHQTSAE